MNSKYYFFELKPELKWPLKSYDFSGLSFDRSQQNLHNIMINCNTITAHRTPNIIQKFLAV